jgi:hypothetical protein
MLGCYFTKKSFIWFLAGVCSTFIQIDILFRASSNGDL